jgi:hypothetical protein
MNINKKILTNNKQLNDEHKNKKKINKQKKNKKTQVHKIE